MIDARWHIACVFKDLYLSGLGDIRPQQTEFAKYLVELLSSIQFDSRIFEFHTGRNHIAYRLVLSI